MKALAVMPPDRWMEINLLDTLGRHFCERLRVFTYPGGMGRLGSKLWRSKRDKLNEQLVQLAGTLKSAGELDLMFFIVYDDFLTVESARRLRRMNVPMVNYHVDMAFQWYRVIKTAPYFDVLAVAQMTNADRLESYGATIHYMPMAANPDWYDSHAMPHSGSRHDVSFVGTFNPYRRALIADCAKHGFKPAVYGRGWNSEAPSPYQFDWDGYKVLHDLWFYGMPRWKAEGMQSVVGAVTRKYARKRVFEELIGPEFYPPCTDEALPEIFKSSKVNLGFSDTGWHGAEQVIPSKNLQCRLRDFEVPMSGGFYLVQEAPGHAEYYKVGEEIETWREPEGLIDKLRYYTKNESAAWRIREAGRKRALECHTWEQRFAGLFGTMRTLGCRV